MPRLLIRDAHEWINEIPIVPTHYLANTLPGERAWRIQRGKKTLLSLTLVRIGRRLPRCRIGGRGNPPVKYPHLDDCRSYRVKRDAGPGRGGQTPEPRALWLLVTRGATRTRGRRGFAHARPGMPRRVTGKHPDGEFGWGGTPVKM